MNLAWLRKVFEVETLPSPPSEVGPAAKRTSFVRLLVTPEELPFDAVERPSVRAGALQSLLAAEQLPEDPPALPQLRRKGSLLRSLLAPEQLPEAEPAAPRTGGRWLAWMLKPEDLDQNGQ